jgi:hypothetical protein
MRPGLLSPEAFCADGSSRAVGVPIHVATWLCVALMALADVCAQVTSSGPCPTPAHPLNLPVPIPEDSGGFHKACTDAQCQTSQLVEWHTSCLRRRLHLLRGFLPWLFLLRLRLLPSRSQSWRWRHRTYAHT